MKFTKSKLQRSSSCVRSYHLYQHYWGRFTLKSCVMVCRELKGEYRWLVENIWEEDILWSSRAQLCKQVGACHRISVLSRWSKFSEPGRAKSKNTWYALQMKRVYGLVGQESHHPRFKVWISSQQLQGKRLQTSMSGISMDHGLRWYYNDDTKILFYYK